MVLSKAQVTDVFKKSNIRCSNDAIEALYQAKIANTDVAIKITKSAFYVASKESRSIVTAKDINSVLAEMNKPSTDLQNDAHLKVPKEAEPIIKVLTSAINSGSMDDALKKFGSGLSAEEVKSLKTLTSIELKSFAEMRKKFFLIAKASHDRFEASESTTRAAICAALANV